MELYQAAINQLVDIWYWRSNHSPSSVRKPKTELDVRRHELFDILPQLAHYIHQHKPTGFVQENELHRLFCRELAISRREPDPSCPTPKTRGDVDSFVALLRDDVGLLAAGGERIYRFLHLTFQEYLAGQAIFRDLQKAPEEFHKRQADPRWRVPLLMGLGYIGREKTDSMPMLVSSLLATDDRLNDLFPQATILLMDAINQMHDVSRDVVSLVIRKAAKTYCEMYSNGRLQASRSALEQAIRSMISDDKHSNVVEAECREMLTIKGNPQSIAGAYVAGVTALIRRVDLSSRKIADTLAQILHCDSPDDGFSVTETLILQLCPAAVPSEGLREARPRVQWTAPRLSLRQAFIRDLQLVEFVKHDMDWLLLIVALCGGYWHLNAASDVNKYRRIASYLNMLTVDRSPFIVYFSERYGQDDCVYNMFLLLYANGEEWKRRWKTPAQFHPGGMYRQPPFADLLLDSLNSRKPVRLLLPELRDLALQEDKIVRTESLVGIWALEADVDVFHGQPPSSEFSCRLGSMMTGLRDAVTRIQLDALGKAFKNIPSLRLLQLFDSLAWTVLDAGGEQPFDTIDLLRTGVPPGAFSRMTAEFLVCSLKQFDVTPDHDKLMTRFEGGLQESVASISALLEIGKSTNRTYNYSSYWQVDPLCFESLNHSDDIPPTILDLVAETIPDHHSALQLFIFRRVFIPIITQNQQLIPEILVLLLSDFRLRQQRQVLIDEFNPELENNSRALDNVWDLIEELTSPFHRARAILRLVLAFPEFHALGNEELSRLLIQITEPLHRFELLEKLCLHSSRAHRDHFIELCHEAAENIEERAERSRALCRLARIVPSFRQTEILQKAVRCLRKVEPTTKRAILFQQFREAYWDNRSILDELNKHCWDIHDPIDRNYALGRHGSVLQHTYELLGETSSRVTEHWTAAVLFARALETCGCPRSRLRGL